MIAGYAAAKGAEQADEEERERIDFNGAYKLKMKGRDGGDETGAPQQSAFDYQESASSNMDNFSSEHNNVADGDGKSAISKVNNIAQKGGKSYYDSSTNTHKQRA
jgi:hypothetical protein